MSVFDYLLTVNGDLVGGRLSDVTKGRIGIFAGDDQIFYVHQAQSPNLTTNQFLFGGDSDFDLFSAPISVGILDARGKLTNNAKLIPLIRFEAVDNPETPVELVAEEGVLIFKMDNPRITNPFVPGESFLQHLLRNPDNFNLVTEEDAHLQRPNGTYFVLTNVGEILNVIAFCSNPLEVLDLNKNQPYPQGVHQLKLYESVQEMTIYDSVRKLGPLRYLINMYSGPDSALIHFFGLDFSLMPETIYRTIEQDELQPKLTRRIGEDTIIEGIADGLWILPPPNNSRQFGNLKLTGDVNGRIILFNVRTGRTLYLDVVTDKVEYLACIRCRQDFNPKLNTYGSCQWHTQHAQTRNIEASRKLISVFTYGAKPEQSLRVFLRTHPERTSLVRVITAKIAWLQEHANYDPKLQFTTSPLLLSISELDGKARVYSKFTNDVDGPRRKYARVASHILDQRSIEHCLTLPYFDPEDPDHKLELGHAKNPNFYFGTIVREEDRIYWNCCLQRGSHPGCWKGQHSAFTVEPDLQDSSIGKHGTTHLNDIYATTDQYDAIAEANRIGDYEQVLQLESQFNFIHGGVLIPVSNAPANAKKYVDVVDRLTTKQDIDSIKRILHLTDAGGIRGMWQRSIKLSLEYQPIKNNVPLWQKLHPQYYSNILLLHQSDKGRVGPKKVEFIKLEDKEKVRVYNELADKFVALRKQFDVSPFNKRYSADVTVDYDFSQIPKMNKLRYQEADLTDIDKNYQKLNTRYQQLERFAARYQEVDSAYSTWTAAYTAKLDLLWRDYNQLADLYLEVIQYESTNGTTLIVKSSDNWSRAFSEIDKIHRTSSDFDTDFNNEEERLLGLFTTVKKQRSYELDLQKDPKPLKTAPLPRLEDSPLFKEIREFLIPVNVRTTVDNLRRSISAYEASKIALLQDAQKLGFTISPQENEEIKKMRSRLDNISSSSSPQQEVDSITRELDVLQQKLTNDRKLLDDERKRQTDTRNEKEARTRAAFQKDYDAKKQFIEDTDAELQKYKASQYRQKIPPFPDPDIKFTDDNFIKEYPIWVKKVEGVLREMDLLIDQGNREIAGLDQLAKSKESRERVLRDNAKLIASVTDEYYNLASDTYIYFSWSKQITDQFNDAIAPLVNPSDEEIINQNIKAADLKKILVDLKQPSLDLVMGDFEIKERVQAIEEFPSVIKPLVEGVKASGITVTFPNRDGFDPEIKSIDESIEKIYTNPKSINAESKSVQTQYRKLAKDATFFIPLVDYELQKKNYLDTVLSYLHLPSYDALRRASDLTLTDDEKKKLQEEVAAANKGLLLTYDKAKILHDQVEMEDPEHVPMLPDSQDLTLDLAEYAGDYNTISQNISDDLKERKDVLEGLIVEYEGFIPEPPPIVVDPQQLDKLKASIQTNRDKFAGLKAPFPTDGVYYEFSNAWIRKLEDGLFRADISTAQGVPELTAINNGQKAALENLTNARTQTIAQVKSDGTIQRRIDENSIAMKTLTTTMEQQKRSGIVAPVERNPKSTLDTSIFVLANDLKTSSNPKIDIDDVLDTKWPSIYNNIALTKSITVEENQPDINVQIRSFLNDYTLFSSLNNYQIVMAQSAGLTEQQENDIRQSIGLYNFSLQKLQRDLEVAKEKILDIDLDYFDDNPKDEYELELITFEELKGSADARLQEVEAISKRRSDEAYAALASYERIYEQLKTVAPVEVIDEGKIKVIEIPITRDQQTTKKLQAFMKKCKLFPNEINFMVSSAFGMFNESPGFPLEAEGNVDTLLYEALPIAGRDMWFAAANLLNEEELLKLLVSTGTWANNSLALQFRFVAKPGPTQGNYVIEVIHEETLIMTKEKVDNSPALTQFYSYVGQRNISSEELDAKLDQVANHKFAPISVITSFDKKAYPAKTAARYINYAGRNYVSFLTAIYDNTSLVFTFVYRKSIDGLIPLLTDLEYEEVPAIRNEDTYFPKIASGKFSTHVLLNRYVVTSGRATERFKWMVVMADKEGIKPPIQEPIAYTLRAVLWKDRNPDDPLDSLDARFADERKIVPTPNSNLRINPTKWIDVTPVVAESSSTVEEPPKEQPEVPIDTTPESAEEEESEVILPPPAKPKPEPEPEPEPESQPQPEQPGGSTDTTPQPTEPFPGNSSMKEGESSAEYIKRLKLDEKTFSEVMFELQIPGELFENYIGDANRLADNVVWYFGERRVEKSRFTMRNPEKFIREDRYLDLDMEEYRNSLAWILTFMQSGNRCFRSPEFLTFLAKLYSELDDDQKTEEVSYTPDLLDNAKPTSPVVQENTFTYHSDLPIVPLPFPLLDPNIIYGYWVLSTQYPVEYVIHSDHFGGDVIQGTYAEKLQMARFIDQDHLKQLSFSSAEWTLLFGKDFVSTVRNDKPTAAQKRTIAERSVVIFKAIDPQNLFGQEFNGNTISAAGGSLNYKRASLDDDQRSALLVRLLRLDTLPAPTAGNADLYALAALLKRYKEAVSMFETKVRSFLTEANFKEFMKTLNVAPKIDDLVGKSYKTNLNLLNSVYSEGDQRKYLRYIFDPEMMLPAWMGVAMPLFYRLFVVSSYELPDKNYYHYAVKNVKDGKISSYATTVYHWEEDTVEFKLNSTFNASSPAFEVLEIASTAESKMARALFAKTVLDYNAHSQLRAQEKLKELLCFLEPNLKPDVAVGFEFGGPEIFARVDPNLVTTYGRWGFKTASPDYVHPMTSKIEAIITDNNQKNYTAESWMRGYLSGILFDFDAKQNQQGSAIFSDKKRRNFSKLGIPGYEKAVIPLAVKSASCERIPVPSTQIEKEDWINLRDNEFPEGTSIPKDEFDKARATNNARMVRFAAQFNIANSLPFLDGKSNFRSWLIDFLSPTSTKSIIPLPFMSLAEREMLAKFRLAASHYQ